MSKIFFTNPNRTEHTPLIPEVPAIETTSQTIRAIILKPQNEKGPVGYPDEARFSIFISKSLKVVFI
ncbi:hypothetical protein [Maridesulfovibrio sp.]|uniref:hypothetical protein n=1 Tax=unclassified Maridesulfovibrio TaxID=2794999 RepID=UPI003AFF84E7